jgi:endoglucanase
MLTWNKPLIFLALGAALAGLTGCASLDPGLSAPAPLATNAIELAQAMGNGINLGNTMEAYGRAKVGTTGSVSSYETAWGQPVTTPEIIHFFKESGFDSIRIPVAWTNTMAYEKGDYTIRPDYLARVGELIDMALAEHMYVIINDHWDGSWWGMFGSATEATRQKAMDLYVAMWTQIAQAYQDRSPYLIFESANEELGNRLNDKDVAKDSGTLNEDQCYQTTNRINQAFVDTVRKSGGNNSSRFLLIAGYNTDIDKTVDPRFVMPTDTLANRLLVSVHYYSPSDYCIFPSVNRWGNRDEYQQMNAAFKKMTQFTKAGYGVVVGEYGVSLKDDGSVKKNTAAFLTNVLDNSDRYGYAPMLWDCSSLYKRSSQSVLDQEINSLYASRNLASERGKTQDDITLAAQQAMASSIAAAPEAVTLDPHTAMAWIMYNASDYQQSYSVGDKYNPGSKSEGVVAKDVVIPGPGTYTVSLDFTGTPAGSANSVAFSALGIANGETLFPGFGIDLKKVVVNGKAVTLKGTPYTTSDNAVCTRVNLFNSWVTSVPEGVRVASGDPLKVSARLLDDATLGNVKTIEVTFEFRKL